MASGPDTETLMNAAAGGAKWTALALGAFAFLRWLLGLAGARQDKRIAELEKRDADRALEYRRLNDKLTAVALLASELASVVEQIDPNATVLLRARKLLDAAFPVAATPPDMTAMAAEIDKMTQSKG